MISAEAIRANPRLRLSPHFLAVELVAQTEPGSERDARWAERAPLLTDAHAASLVVLAEKLEQVRALVDRPLRITSGYRPRSSGSQHAVGQAADVQADGVSPLELACQIRAAGIPGLRQVIAESRGTGLDGPMGVGTNRWVHVAVLGPGYRATRSAWLETGTGQAPYHTLRAKASS